MNGSAWHRRHLEADGIGIHYVRHGVGPPLVLLHGWPEFWYTWRKNLPVLARECDMVAPDLRGFGDTDKPVLPDPPKSLLGTLVEDLRGLADSLGFERFGVVSHDVGTYVAQGFARKYPERFSGLTLPTVRFPTPSGR
jgi:pimeloyl-ACP methyl ester carboxylesterase